MSSSERLPRGAPTVHERRLTPAVGPSGRADAEGSASGALNPLGGEPLECWRARGRRPSRSASPGGRLDRDGLDAGLPARVELERARGGGDVRSRRRRPAGSPSHPSSRCGVLSFTKNRCGFPRSSRGNWSGPVGSTRGQQPFRDGLVVREAQAARWGFTPHYGHVEVECRASLTRARCSRPGWSGLRYEPDDCGEICLVEVSRRHARRRSRSPRSATGSSASAIRRLRRGLRRSAPTRSTSPRPHVYAAEWRQRRRRPSSSTANRCGRSRRRRRTRCRLHHRGLRLPRAARRPQATTLAAPELVVRRVCGRAA